MTSFYVVQHGDAVLDDAHKTAFDAMSYVEQQRVNNYEWDRNINDLPLVSLVWSTTNNRQRTAGEWKITRVDYDV